jgi:hypothetical protein
MGSMRNGQGDHYFGLFTADGCWLKGFHHEAPMSPWANDPPKIAAGVFDGVPAEFQACLTESAFVIHETTFCIWRRYSDRAWYRGPVAFPAGEEDSDGSADLLEYLDGRPQTFRAAQGRRVLPELFRRRRHSRVAARRGHRARDPVRGRSCHAVQPAPGADGPAVTLLDRGSFAIVSLCRREVITPGRSR